MAAREIRLADSDDPAANAVGRSNLYGFLSMIFREEPSLELVRKIKDGALLGALAGAGARLGSDFRDRADEELADDLAVEYARLFVGPGKHIPPYEAAQREGALWGKATSDVVAFIGKCGFAYAEDYSGLPDHIAVELEFMQAVTRREADAWKAGDAAGARRLLEIERDFIRDHLSRWAPGFLEQVADGAESSFYREIAGLTRSFIQSEGAEIRKRLGDGRDVGA